MIKGPTLTIVYRNHKGTIATRHVRPVYTWYGSTEWHPDEQWLLNVYDEDKGEYRDYAMGDMLGAPAPAPAPASLDVPGHTCPAIDRTLRCIRRAEWRLRADGYVGTRGTGPSVKNLLAEARAELEQVREENRQMRAAYHAERANVRRLTALLGVP